MFADLYCVNIGFVYCKNCALMVESVILSDEIILKCFGRLK